MKRVTIYVDEGIWDEVKLCAWNLSSSEKRVSAGQYLLGLHIKNKSDKKEPKIPKTESEPIKPDKVILDEKEEPDKLVKKAIKLKETKGTPVFGYPKSYQARK